MLLNSGLPNTLWCYAPLAAVDIYRYTYHSALNMTTYKLWYGTKPHWNIFLYLGMLCLC